MQVISTAARFYPGTRQEASVLARSVAGLSLAAYAAVVPFQRLFVVGPVGSPATAAAVLAIVMSVPAVLGRVTHRLHRFFGAMAVLVSTVVLGLGATSLPTRSPAPYLRGLGPQVAQQALGLLIITWLCWEFLDRRGLVRAACGYVLGCYVGVVGSLSKIDDIRQANRGAGTLRVTASESTLPNVQALVFVIGVPLAIFAFDKVRQPLLRAAMLGYPAVALAGVLLTGSRSGLGGLAIATVCLLPATRRLPVPLRSAALILIVCAIPIVPRLLPSDPVERATSTVDDSEFTSESRDVRLSLWSQGFAVIDEHPWFGSGQGAVRNRIVETTTSDQENSSHNSFLNVAAEYGLIAVACLIAVYLAALADALRRTRNRPIALALIVPVIAVMQVVNWEWEKANWLAIVFTILIVRDADETEDADQTAVSVEHGSATSGQPAGIGR